MAYRVCLFVSSPPPPPPRLIDWMGPWSRRVIHTIRCWKYVMHAFRLVVFRWRGVVFDCTYIPEKCVEGEWMGGWMGG